MSEPGASSTQAVDARQFDRFTPEMMTRQMEWFLNFSDIKGIIHSVLPTARSALSETAYARSTGRKLQDILYESTIQGYDISWTRPSESLKESLRACQDFLVPLYHTFLVDDRACECPLHRAQMSRPGFRFASNATRVDTATVLSALRQSLEAAWTTQDLPINKQQFEATLKVFESYEAFFSTDDPSVSLDTFYRQSCILGDMIQQPYMRRRSANSNAAVASGLAASLAILWGSMKAASSYLP